MHLGYANDAQEPLEHNKAQECKAAKTLSATEDDPEAQRSVYA